MNGKVYFKKLLIILGICLLISTSFPLISGESSDLEVIRSVEDNVITRDSKHYNDCKIIISGRCNTVIGPLVWLFGFYCPLFERNFKVEANGELGEKLNVIVLSPEFGTFISYEHIEIDIFSAKGVFYWGEKSIIFKEPLIFVYCKAADVRIYY